MAVLSDKIGELDAVAKKLSKKLEKIGIETIYDLIFYYPFRYEKYDSVSLIAELVPGQEAVVIGKVELLASRRSSRQRKYLVEAMISDESGSIKAIWFNQPWLAKTLKAGDVIMVYGRVSGETFSPYFSSPNYERPRKNGSAPGILPVYPLTAGITSRQISSLAALAISRYSDAIDDPLPAYILKNNDLPDLIWAIRQIHFPEKSENIVLARRRLAFDELFLLQLWSQLARRELKRSQAPQIKFNEQKIKEFVNSLAFDLTLDQKRAAWEVIQDMGKGEPMNRLLEGDVGSGKTAVAVLAMYNNALSGWQTALMAPTEILASQHYQTISKLLGNSGLNVGLFTRNQKTINGESVSKKDFLARCADGGLDIAIGTHALIYDGIEFNRLALVIIDEQHRFGVKQRQRLKEKTSLVPHFLSLTATPIPRTMALIAYGDLDISLLRQMPQGRLPIITKVVSPQQRSLAYDFIGKQIAAGRQVFVICPLINPSDKLGVRSVNEEYKKLDKEVFPNLSVGLLHGRLKSEEKEAVMAGFVRGEIKILVSTSVIEVGVDVPNASVMMIEGSERFGLAQLHQFRGRVGRGKYQSYCFLFSDASDEKANSRLDFLAKSSDGFRLAEYDLSVRGGGSFYGTEQSGFDSGLKLADINDIDLVKKSSEAVKSFLETNNPDDFPGLSGRLKQKELISHLE